MNSYRYIEMKDLNPMDIFTYFQSGKIDSFNTIENLLSICRTTRNEVNRIQVVDIILEMYRNAESNDKGNSQQLKSYIEETVGKKFISKYNINPREAMGLGLLEILINQELLNDEVYPEIHHVHAAFRMRDRHVMGIDIVEVECPKVGFIDLFPNILFLRISMAGLKEIEGFKQSPNLKRLDLSANELKDIKGIEHLKSLEKLDLNLNKIIMLTFSEPLEKLEELLISFNPLIKINGINNLKNLKYIEFEETKLSQSEITKIKKKI